MRKLELKPEDGIESTPGPGGTRAAPLQASWAGLQWVPQCVSVDPALGEAAPSPVAVGIAPLASEMRVSGSPGLDYIVRKKGKRKRKGEEKKEKLSLNFHHYHPTDPVPIGEPHRLSELFCDEGCSCVTEPSASVAPSTRTLGSRGPTVPPHPPHDASIQVPLTPFMHSTPPLSLPTTTAPVHVINIAA